MTKSPADDLVERLEARRTPKEWISDGRGSYVQRDKHDPLCTEAAARIRSLEEQNAALIRRRDDLLTANNGYLERARQTEAQRDEAVGLLGPFAGFAENVDADGWTSNIHREAISVWFGPSDFRSARAFLDSLKEGR